MPADENAHVELLRADVLAGSRSRAMRRYEAMEQVLMDELGVSPSPEAVALRERALALSSVGTQPTAAPLPRRLRIERPLGAVAGGLLEREEPLRELAGALDDALARERGSVVLIAGEAGCGKSSLLVGVPRRRARTRSTWSWAAATTCWPRARWVRSGTWR